MSAALALVAAATWSVDWRAPPDCPEGAPIEARVEELVGGTPQGPLQASVIVEAQEDGTFEATLQLDAGTGRTVRVLRGESCQAVSDATAVIVALALDAQPERRTVVRPGPPRNRTTESEPFERFGLELSAETGTGFLPGLGAGGAARGFARLFGTRLGLGVLGWIPSSVGSEATQVEAQLWTSELRLGVPFDLGRLELEPAGLFELGRFSGRGSGESVGNERTRRSWHVAGGADIGLAWPLGEDFWLNARLGARWALARPQLSIRSLGVLFQTARFAPRFGLGVQMRLR